ncbi:hypothetical protein B0H21DRAFT_781440 [Amylocystis lapponica]|nr:hypothetical protein B0H21DRAFT_781440 [Amylocystis lapponica]
MTTTQTEYTHDSPFHVTLTEEYVQDSFHSYLKSSLTHAKVEGLLDTDILSSAEGDLMITGSSILFIPPSVPLPKRSKSADGAVFLSDDNCPAAFRPFWMVWSQAVPEIQLLPPEYQHDLARIICGLPPVSQPPNPLAIEISMRRTFQDRYAGDLQAAIDAGTGSSAKVKASFTPPPSYDAPPKDKPARLSGIHLSQARLPRHEFIRETLYAALADVLERVPSLRRWLRTDPARGYFAAVAFAILDVASSCATHASAHAKTIADAYPDGGDTAHPAEPTIRGVLGQTLALSQCPPELRPFMRELCAIGTDAAVMEEEDSALSVQAVQHGEALPAPRLERVREILEGGVGHAYSVGHAGRNGHQSGARRSDANGAVVDPRRRTTSTENRAVAFANRINALSLAMTKLRAFRERQEMVFQVLAGVGG